MLAREDRCWCATWRHQIRLEGISTCRLFFLSFCFLFLFLLLFFWLAVSLDQQHRIMWTDNVVNANLHCTCLHVVVDLFYCILLPLLAFSVFFFFFQSISCISFSLFLTLFLISDVADFIDREDRKEEDLRSLRSVAIMFLWLILTGLICFLLGIALTLAVGQQKILFWIMPLMDSDDKLLPQLNPENTTPLIQSEKPISVGLPEVIIFTSR